MSEPHEYCTVHDQPLDWCERGIGGVTPHAADDGTTLMCMVPADCPNGPDVHPFADPDLTLMCCCRQPWEEQADQLMDANDRLLQALADDTRPE